MASLVRGIAVALRGRHRRGAINPIVYAEVSFRFTSIEELQEALPAELLERRALAWEAAFLAGKCSRDPVT